MCINNTVKSYLNLLILWIDKYKLALRDRKRGTEFRPLHGCNNIVPVVNKVHGTDEKTTINEYVVIYSYESFLNVLSESETS